MTEQQTTQNPGNEPLLSSEEKLWVVVAHLGGAFLFFLPPLIVWLVKKDESEFLADQAKEALNFQITVGIAMMIGMLSMCFFIGVLLLPGVYLANVAFSILAAISSADGVRYRYPVTLRLID